MGCCRFGWVLWAGRALGFTDHSRAHGMEAVSAFTAGILLLSSRLWLWVSSRCPGFCGASQRAPNQVRAVDAQAARACQPHFLWLKVRKTMIKPLAKQDHIPCRC